MSKDYYQILGVAQDASQGEIKQAFRKLAHQHHPDKKSGDEQKFKEINQAYQVLSDPKKRQQYDSFGANFEGASGWQGWQQQEGFTGFDFADLGQLFKEVFKEAFVRREQVVTVPISFTQAALGDTIRLSTLKGPIKIKIPAGIQSGETLRAPGLLIQIIVQTPTGLNRKQKKILKEFNL